MKRLFALLLAAALLLCGCYGIELLDEPAEAPTPTPAEPALEAEPQAAALPENAVALTDEEIAQVNAAFAPFLENNTVVNPLGQFLMCWYSSPAELDLTELLRYHSVFHDGSEVVTDPEEFAALASHENWCWQNATLETMPVPIHRIPADHVEQVLQTYLGVGVADVTYTPSSDLLYLPEYDCYYNFTSDAGFGIFECTGGWLSGETLTLLGQHSTLTLRKNGEGWLFYSYLPAESEA